MFQTNYSGNKCGKGCACGCCPRSAWRRYFPRTWAAATGPRRALPNLFFQIVFGRRMLEMSFADQAKQITIKFVMGLLELQKLENITFRVGGCFNVLGFEVGVADQNLSDQNDLEHDFDLEQAEWQSIWLHWTQSNEIRNWNNTWRSRYKVSALLIRLTSTKFFHPHPVLFYFLAKMLSNCHQFQETRSCI